MTSAATDTLDIVADRRNSVRFEVDQFPCVLLRGKHFAFVLVFHSELFEISPNHSARRSSHVLRCAACFRCGLFSEFLCKREREIERVYLRVNKPFGRSNDLPVDLVPQTVVLLPQTAEQRPSAANHLVCFVSKRRFISVTVSVLNGPS